jgi:hypothetical protein
MGTFAMTEFIGRKAVSGFGFINLLFKTTPKYLDILRKRREEFAMVLSRYKNY